MHENSEGKSKEENELDSIITKCKNMSVHEDLITDIARWGEKMSMHQTRSTGTPLSKSEIENANNYKMNDHQTERKDTTIATDSDQADENASIDSEDPYENTQNLLKVLLENFKLNQERDCEKPWEVSNAVSNRRMWGCETPGACKTTWYSAMDITEGHHA